MAPPSDDTAGLPHGARDLPSLRVDAYNAELTDPSGEGFLGGRASNSAFVEILEDWRERVSRMQDVERWGVLTIGTGLGNARFSNRSPRPG